MEIVLGHRFANAERLEHALTHRSHRQSSEAVDNERLEFLGDRVLGLVASEQLCRLFPHWDAGKLSKGLARLVSASSIHTAAMRLDLGAYLRLGPGEEKTGGREKKRLLADAYEAIVGFHLPRCRPRGGGGVPASHVNRSHALGGIGAP